MSSDEAIQLTNNDACNFKAFAVAKGYWNDPYIYHFASKQQLVEHKPPEMSLGYFARVNAMRTIVNKFMDKYGQQKCQIVNIGAGYDTLFFNLVEAGKQPAKFVEIDFPRIVMSKIRTIKSKKPLNDKVFPPTPPAPSSSSQPGSEFKMPSLPISSAPSSEIHSNNYHLISADLRNIKEVEKKLINDCQIDYTLPTLILAECVLVYMTTENSNNLLKYFTSSFSKCCLINYEQVNLNDKFGEIMLSNMQMRECKLLGIDPCGSIDTQFNRFVQAGFDINTCQIVTMTDYYKNKMSQADRNRVESLEFLDEKELLFQLMDHYCICIVGNSVEFKFMLF